MRKVVYFREDSRLHELLSYFKLQQGPVYHYTNQLAAESMASGKIRLTRADCMEDQSEIQFGISLLAESLGTNSSYSSIPEDLKLRLEHCYVLSLTGDANNQHLRQHYGQHLIEFANPAFLYLSGHHAVPNDTDGYNLHWFHDLYDGFEGNVIYDQITQQKIVDNIVELLPIIDNPETHIVDRSSFITKDLILPFLLFKRPNFEPEDEYRIILVRKHGIDDSFELSRSENPERKFIEALVPPKEARDYPPPTSQKT